MTSISRRSCTMLVGVVLAVAVQAHGGVHATIGGQRFSAPTPHLAYWAYSGVELAGVAHYRWNGRRSRAALRLQCDLYNPSPLPQTVDCSYSSFEISSPNDPSVGVAWGNSGTLQATFTSFVTLPHDRWRVRGTFTGALHALAGTSSDLEITSGRFAATLKDGGEGGAGE